MTSWVRAVSETDRARVAYVRTGGEKPPLVLLHGLTGSGATWTPLARALEADFDVVMPDARGHGDSSASERTYRYDDLARDVEELVRDRGLVRPVLLGHSMGGMTAALVASRNPGLLRGLVLVDPTFLEPERQREVHASDVAAEHARVLSLTREAFLAELRARHPHRSAEMIELLAEARQRTRLEAFDVLTPPNPPYRDVVRAIDVPTLLVFGDRSPVVTVETARELHAVNPAITIVPIAGAGHGLPFDAPQALATVASSFLASLSGDGPRGDHDRADQSQK